MTISTPTSALIFKKDDYFHANVGIVITPTGEHNLTTENLFSIISKKNSANALVFSENDYWIADAGIVTDADGTAHNLTQFHLFAVLPRIKNLGIVELP
jgi:hypothetical protein